MHAPPLHRLVRSFMPDPLPDWIDKLARKSPTALAMALERAIETRNRALEKAVLTALGELGIAVVDRATLADNLSSTIAPANELPREATS